MTSENPWHPLLFRGLRGRALPVFDFGPMVIPAASVWTASREWVSFFRGSGLAPGDRIVLAVEPSPAFLAVLVASLWEGLTLAVADPSGPCSSRPARLLERFDARLAVVHEMAGGAEHVAAATYASPPTQPPRLRHSVTPPTPDLALLLCTSGTSGRARAVGLTSPGVLSVVTSHLPELAMEQAVVASVLPWHHSFGLVLELLTSMLTGAVVLRVSNGGRDPSQLLDRIKGRGVTHVSGVPLMFSRLVEHPDGRTLLRGLRGGIVGGAPLSQRLSDALTGTRLRVGYGQTEASPGITLGSPGVFRRGLLGREVGCETRHTARGTLAFRGPNTFAGYFDADRGGLDPMPPCRLDGGWVDTGDLVEQGGDGWIYVGRADDSFKLCNGRRVDAPVVEDALCRSLPDVDEAAVFTDDGERLFVALSVAPGAAMPARGSVAEALGPLSPYLAGVLPLPGAMTYRTAKGLLDRKKLAELAVPAPRAA